MIVLPAAVPLLLLLLVLALGLLVVLVELRVLSYAYQKIGIRPRYVLLIMVLTLVGGHVNIPLYSVPHVGVPDTIWLLGDPDGLPGIVQHDATVVAINVGGALIPALLSIYLFLRMRMPWRMLIGTAVVALVVNQVARVVPGEGIVVPVLLPPLLAAGVALVLALRRAPPLAYVAGTMGALIGADLLNLGRVAEMGAQVASIGGAGTFDAVFLTGILAGLLA